jgi:lysophospholipase L1-like esterase
MEKIQVTTGASSEASWMLLMSKVKRVIVSAGLAACILLAATGCQSTKAAPKLARGDSQLARPAAMPHDFAKWEKEIAAIEAADKTNPPPKGGILFIGSSTIRMWKSLQQDFPQHKVINRGFGGSEIADSTHFADRLIFPHEPRQIFLRAGNNDIHNGRLPQELAGDFAEFVRTIHERLPRTEITFISLCGVPDRWPEKDKNELLNSLIRQMALNMPRVSYVDAWNISLNESGQARPELFLPDKLHFNAEGYKLLAERVRPYLPVIK